MNNKEFARQIKLIKKVGRELCSSKKKARKFLKEIGIYTK